MRYVLSRIETETQDKAYRIYVTDCLNFIAENTAHYAGGKAFSKRYTDLFVAEPTETRTDTEIIDGIKNKISKLRV